MGSLSFRTCKLDIIRSSHVKASRSEHLFSENFPTGHSLSLCGNALQNVGKRLSAKYNVFASSLIFMLRRETDLSTLFNQILTI